jgi:small subunit ribosomal protein S6
MEQYETLVLLHPDSSEMQIREAIERAKKLIEGMRGQVRQVQEWGMRDLAYQIQKQKRGYYVILEYVAGGEAVRELERTLRIADEVLRFISVRTAEVKRKEKPSRKRSRAARVAAEESSAARE